MEALLTNVGTNIVLSLLYSLVNYTSKVQNGESLSGKKMGRTAAVGVVLGVIANLTGFELTDENWQAFAAANTGVIATTDKVIIALLKTELVKRILPLLILVVMFNACARISLPPVEDIRAQLDTAEITLVAVDQIALELELSGVADTDDVAEVRGKVEEARALIATARVFLSAGERKDAVAALIEVNRLLVDLKRKE